MLNSKSRFLLHFFTVLSVFGLLITEICNQYFFSKSAILESFEFSFAAVGIDDVPMTDRLFIAKLLRREVWIIHFWFGMAFIFVSIVRFLYLVFKRDFHPIVPNIFVFVFVCIQGLTGLPLYLRAYIPIDVNSIDTARVIHSISVDAFYVFIITHITIFLFTQLKLTNKSRNGM